MRPRACAGGAPAPAAPVRVVAARLRRGGTGRGAARPRRANRAPPAEWLRRLTGKFRRLGRRGASRRLGRCRGGRRGSTGWRRRHVLDSRRRVSRRHLMGSVAVPVKVARWVPVAVAVDGHLLGLVAVPVDSRLPGLGRRVLRRHLVEDLGCSGFGGRCRKSDRRRNAQQRWQADEGQGVIDALADRVGQICGDLHRVERRDQPCRALRRRLAPQVAMGGVACWSCGRLIERGQLWDLGHLPDRRATPRPEHRTCNRSRAARQRAAMYGPYWRQTQTATRRTPEALRFFDPHEI